MSIVGGARFENSRDMQLPRYRSYRDTVGTEYTIYSITCTDWKCQVVLHNFDTDYPHDSRADNATYPHDSPANKWHYLHDRKIKYLNMLFVKCLIFGLENMHFYDFNSQFIIPRFRFALYTLP